jgi:hypothetical protein
MVISLGLTGELALASLLQYLPTSSLILPFSQREKEPRTNLLFLWEVKYPTRANDNFTYAAARRRPRSWGRSK